jgi:hypothetical protein
MKPSKSFGWFATKKDILSKREEVRNMVRRIKRGLIFLLPTNYYKSSDRIEKDQTVGALYLYGTEGECGDVLVPQHEENTWKS